MKCTNPLRQSLESGHAAVGAVCVLGSIESLEVAAASGFNYALVDWQHGSFNQPTMREGLRALDAMGCPAVARPPVPEGHWIEWLLDMGYMSLLLPMVDNAEIADAAVRAASYPPRGLRSQASARAVIRYGADYRSEIGDALMLTAMIETTEAVDAIEKIAAVDGIHGCFIGTTDLASSLGVNRGEATDKELEAMVEHVRRATLDAGKIPGIACPDPDTAKRRIAEGFRLLTLASDLRFVTAGYRSAIEAVRA